MTPRPDVETAADPDGTVTLMFSDIESSTVLLERLGDTAFVRLLGWHDAIVRDAAGEHRGYIVKSRGDGFMIAFPSAAFALRCGSAIQQRLASGYDGVTSVSASACTPVRRSATPTISTAGPLSSPLASQTLRSAARCSYPNSCTNWHAGLAHSDSANRGLLTSKDSKVSSVYTPLTTPWTSTRDNSQTGRVPASTGRAIAWRRNSPNAAIPRV